MISSVVPLYAGNALRLSVLPPAGAKLWRILRKATDTFTGESDTGAFKVYEGDDKYSVDVTGLVNGTPVFYRAYYFDGAAWTPSATATGTPSASYVDASTDALTLVRDRLEAGLSVELARGTLGSADGYIQVFTAPPVADESTRFPLVTVHLENEDPAERGVGEMVGADEFDEISGKWSEAEGWLARVTLELAGWSMNPDERIELRKALRRIVVANLEVFDAAGLTEIVFTQRDTEDFSSYGAPVYMATGTFTCLAPIAVRNSVNPIEDVFFTTNVI